MFRGVAMDLFGTTTPEIPVWDIDEKVNTVTGASTKRKVLKLDLADKFRRYDVMETLGLDPEDLADDKIAKLRIKM